MRVTFENITVGKLYSRPELAKLWETKSYQGFAKGVFTPSKSNLIVLFATKEKQKSLQQYNHLLVDDILSMEGEDKGGTDLRIINSASQNDEIHLFYRDRHHRPFTYYGIFALTHTKHQADGPTRFQFAKL